MLIAIFVIALALRLAMVPSAGIYHPDELFQYLEQAHRLAFGPGIVPWEYRYGMRGWLLPLLIAPPMAIGGWIAPGSAAYLLLPRLVAALASLSIVWTSWAIGRSIGRSHGLFAAAVAAIWSEFVYFAPHLLSETASIALILPAAAILLRAPVPRQAMLAGAMLGFAFILRAQHAPAIATLLLMTLRGRSGAWRPVLLGAVVALALGAAIDLAMGQPPYGWIGEYVRQNLIRHRAVRFGFEPPVAYLWGIGMAFGWWTLPIAALAALGLRRAPALFCVGLINLAVHMAIGHKEYRFILLTTTILVLLAAIGTGEIVEKLAQRRPRGDAKIAAVALLLWAIASASLAIDGHAGRFAADPGTRPLFAELRGDPSPCGLATLDMPFSIGGGYTYLHRAMPYLAYDRADRTRLERESAGFDRLIAPATSPAPPGFVRAGCTGSGDAAFCLLRRPGDCAAIRSPAEINQALARGDE